MLAEWLQGVYLFAAVFGVGVTLVDMLGILGQGDHDGAGESADHGAVADDDAPTDARTPLLSILRYLRMAVYFALGFGPLGLVAQVAGATALGSLAWAAPGGIAAAVLAHRFFRFQQRDVDSTVRDEELLFEHAGVIVPLSSTAMGKVRVKLGQAVVERYALAEDAGDTFRTGEVVEIVRVEDNCVYVRRADEQILAAQQKLEVLRRQCEADIERARLEADGGISKARSEGQRVVQETTIELQKLMNVSNVTLEAEARRRAAEIRTASEGEAVRILQETHNDLLRQKVQLVAHAGELGRIALFIQQQLPHLFEAYQRHAQGIDVDTLVVMDDRRGFNGVVNRGPEALVDFLRCFEEGFGLRVRDLLAAAPASSRAEEERS